MRNIINENTSFGNVVTTYNDFIISLGEYGYKNLLENSFFDKYKIGIDSEENQIITYHHWFSSDDYTDKETNFFSIIADNPSIFTVGTQSVESIVMKQKIRLTKDEFYSNPFICFSYEYQNLTIDSETTLDYKIEYSVNGIAKTTIVTGSNSKNGVYDLSNIAPFTSGYIDIFLTISTKPTNQPCNIMIFNIIMYQGRTILPMLINELEQISKDLTYSGTDNTWKMRWYDNGVSKKSEILLSDKQQMVSNKNILLNGYNDGNNRIVTTGGNVINKILPSNELVGGLLPVNNSMIPTNKSVSDHISTVTDGLYKIENTFDYYDNTENDVNKKIIIRQYIEPTSHSYVFRNFNGETPTCILSKMKDGNLVTLLGTNQNLYRFTNDCKSVFKSTDVQMIDLLKFTNNSGVEYIVGAKVLSNSIILFIGSDIMNNNLHGSVSINTSMSLSDSKIKILKCGNKHLVLVSGNYNGVKTIKTYDVTTGTILPLSGDISNITFTQSTIKNFSCSYTEFIVGQQTYKMVNIVTNNGRLKKFDLNDGNKIIDTEDNVMVGIDSTKLNTDYDCFTTYRHTYNNTNKMTFIKKFFINSSDLITQIYVSEEVLYDVGSNIEDIPKIGTIEVIGIGKVKKFKLLDIVVNDEATTGNSLTMAITSIKLLAITNNGVYVIVINNMYNILDHGANVYFFQINNTYTLDKVIKSNSTFSDSDFININGQYMYSGVTDKGVVYLPIKNRAWVKNIENGDNKWYEIF